MGIYNGRAVRKSALNNDPHAQQQWDSASKEEYRLLRCLWDRNKMDAGEMPQRFKLGQYCKQVQDRL